MDFLVLMAYVSLGISILIFAGDFIMQYWLVIRWGPTKTTDLVVDRFQDKVTAGKVREALDLPDRKAINAIVDQMTTLTDKLNAFGVSVDARVTQLGVGMSNDMRQAIGGVENKIGAIRLDPAVLAEDVKKAMLDSGKAMLSREAREANKKREEILQAYQSSVQAQYDRKYIETMLLGLKVPPGMANLAATYGPMGVEWAIRMTFGDRAAADFMGGIQAVKATMAPPVLPPGGYG